MAARGLVRAIAAAKAMLAKAADARVPEAEAKTGRIDSRQSANVIMANGTKGNRQ